MRGTSLNIFAYNDFRKFLEERLEELKTESPKYSKRYFARKLDLKNNNYLKLLIDGEKKLSCSLAMKLVNVVGLNLSESKFFMSLVDFNQAANEIERREALKRMRKHKNFVEVHKLSLDRIDYFADPLMLALRQIVTLDDFIENMEWIKSRLPGQVSESQIKERLEKLKENGLLVRNGQGRLKVTNLHQSSGDRLGSHALRNYHVNMLRLAEKAIQLPVDKRQYRGLTMAIGDDAYEKIIDKYKDFLDEVRQIINDSEDVRHVYHLETALFPLTRVDDIDPSDSGD